jgi:hypothetical protein
LKDIQNSTLTFRCDDQYRIETSSPYITDAY